LFDIDERSTRDQRSSDATTVECASAPRLPRALKVERSASTLTRSNRHVINCSRFLDSRGHRKVTESNLNQSILSFERAHTHKRTIQVQMLDLVRVIISTFIPSPSPKLKQTNILDPIDLDKQELCRTLLSWLVLLFPMRISHPNPLSSARTRKRRTRPER